MIALVLDVETAAYHGLPNHSYQRIRYSVDRVLFVSCDYRFNLEASTGPSDPVQNMISVSNGFLTAVTFTPAHVE